MMIKRKSIFAISVLLGIGSFHSQAIASDELGHIAEYFKDANIVAGPELVECTLSGGTKTTCFSITLKPEPTGYTPGPWCPESIDDSDEKGGVWLESNEVHAVDGAFIKNMATFYEDSQWQLYDPETGKVTVTDTLEKCAGAAKPNVEPEYQQHCVQCLPEYLDDDATVTYTIPLEPVGSGNTAQTNQPGSGVAFNGIRLDGPAPVADILGNYTLAPFDDCGGHINLHVGYHYHIATDCLEETAGASEHANIVGLAMDGHTIHTRKLLDGSMPADLDQCGGHTSEGLSYHYHAGEPGSNAILGCLSSEYGCVSEEQGGMCDASATARGNGPGNGPGGRPDFAAAAKKLGVSEQALMQALGAPPPDFAKTAAALGVSEQQVKDALGAH